MPSGRAGERLEVVAVMRHDLVPVSRQQHESRVDDIGKTGGGQQLAGGSSSGPTSDRAYSGRMSTEDLERYESEIELQLYREYKDVCPMFSYVVETERRFYLANEVRQHVKEDAGRPYVELELHDAWVWDMYRQSRFVSSVRIITFKDVNIEELPKKEL